MTKGLQGETAEKMTADAVNNFLSQVQSGAGVTVCCGEGGRFTLYGERIASVIRCERSRSIHLARLLSGGVLAREGDSWTFYENGGRYKIEPLFSIS